MPQLALPRHLWCFRLAQHLPRQEPRLCQLLPLPGSQLRADPRREHQLRGVSHLSQVLPKTLLK
jgi:hypothetical protein